MYTYVKTKVVVKDHKFNHNIRMYYIVLRMYCNSSISQIVSYIIDVNSQVIMMILSVGYL